MTFRGMVMTPQEIEIVQNVFKAVLAEPWFDRSMENEKEFAAFVLRAYRDGVADHDRLLRYCREAAGVRFSVENS